MHSIYLPCRIFCVFVSSQDLQVRVGLDFMHCSFIMFCSKLVERKQPKYTFRCLFYCASSICVCRFHFQEFFLLQTPEPRFIPLYILKVCSYISFILIIHNILFLKTHKCIFFLSVDSICDLWSDKKITQIAKL